MHKADLDVFRARTDRDFLAVGALRYKCYFADGLIEPREDEIFLDEYDFVEGAQVFAVRHRDRLVSSIRLHVLKQSSAQSATFAAFTDLLQPLLDSGLTIVDGARLVVDPDLGASRLTVARLTLKIASRVAIDEAADYGVAAVQPKHFEFYRRVGNFVKLSEPRDYCELKTKLSLMGVALQTGAHSGQTVSAGAAEQR